MSDLKTLTVIKTPLKKKLLTWVITTEEGTIVHASGTAVAVSEETMGISVYDGNDLVFHNQNVDSIHLLDSERVATVSPLVKPKKKTTLSKKTTPAKKNSGGRSV